MAVRKKAVVRLTFTLPAGLVREYRNALSADEAKVPLGVPELRRSRVERAERAILEAAAGRQ